MLLDNCVSGMPEVSLEDEDLEVTEQAAMRLKSDLSRDPLTGAMLGMDGDSTPAMATDASASGIDPQAAKEKAKKTPPAKKKSSSGTSRDL